MAAAGVLAAGLVAAIVGGLAVAQGTEPVGEAFGISLLAVSAMLVASGVWFTVEASRHRENRPTPFAVEEAANRGGRSASPTDPPARGHDRVAR